MLPWKRGCHEWRGDNQQRRLRNERWERKKKDLFVCNIQWTPLSHRKFKGFVSFFNFQLWKKKEKIMILLIVTVFTNHAWLMWVSAVWCDEKMNEVLSSEDRPLDLEWWIHPFCSHILFTFKKSKHFKFFL